MGRMEKIKNSSPEKHLCDKCRAEVKPFWNPIMNQYEYLSLCDECIAVKNQQQKEEELKKQMAMDEEKRKNKIARLFDSSYLGKRYRGCTFDNFHVMPGTESALTRAQKFVENFGSFAQTGTGLIFFGNFGCGKTHLAAAITRELVTKGKSAIFQVVPDLLSRIRATYNRGSEESEYELINALTEASCLVLDDIGAEYQKKQMDDSMTWAQGILYLIINNRYNEMKPVIYTTNYSLDVLEKRLDGRIYSRMIHANDGVVIEATDYRLRKLEA